jgi:hypothetical protein
MASHSIMLMVDHNHDRLDRFSLLLVVCELFYHKRAYCQWYISDMLFLDKGTSDVWAQQDLFATPDDLGLAKMS